MTAIEVTFRDMFSIGSDAVVLEGVAAKRFISLSIADKCEFLTKLETVTFKNIYDLQIKKI